MDQLGVFLAQEIASLSRGLRVDVRLINHNSYCDRALTSCYIKRSGSLQFAGRLSASFSIYFFSFLLVELFQFFENIAFIICILVCFGTLLERLPSLVVNIAALPVDDFASADSSVSGQRHLVNPSASVRSVSPVKLGPCTLT